MYAMQSAGLAHGLPPHATVAETDAGYVIELDVADFTQRELRVELDDGFVTVTGEQLGPPEDEGLPFRLHERLEETFRLPDDADGQRVEAFFEHGTLELNVPKLGSGGRRIVPILCKPHVNSHATPC